MKDDTKEKQRPRHYFRYGILASIAVLVISLGLALTPGTPPEAPEPAFSEQARAAALAEAKQLRLVGGQLADGTAGAERQALLQAVTLLTIHARALTEPGQESSAAANGTEGSATDRASSGIPSNGASGTAAAPATDSASPPASAAALVAALSASGRQRLTDAVTADGGMARLLAAVGAAQLLQASSLAPSAGVPAPEIPALDFPAATPPAVPDSCQAPGSSSTDGSSPSSPGDPGNPADPAPAGGSSGAATLAAALAMTVKTEAETVYGYQVALARLEGGAAGSASRLLARHESVVSEAEALSRAHCADIPPREAGYTLGPLFLASPAAGLGSLEAGTLPVYGDLVALSEGSTRQWAISGLVSAARRSALWGANAGPLPGLVLDTAQLPPLPPAGPAQEPAETPIPTAGGHSSR